MQQRCRHREPLLIAPGEEAARLAHERFELELLQRPGNALTPSCAAQSIGARKEIEILDYRQIAIERKLLGDITELLAGGRACAVKIDASYSQRAMRWREQAAEHAEGRRFARPVRPEQTEHLAAPNREAHMVNGGEGAEPPHQIVDRDNHLVAIDRRRMLERHSDARPIRRDPMQEEHEAIFEPRASRRHRSAIERRAARFGGHHQTHVAALRHGIDHIGIVQHSRLHPSGRPPGGRFRKKYATCCQLAHFVRTTLGQHLSFEQDDDVRATLGFVKIRSAEQHRETLLIDELQDNCPQLAPRQWIDTDRGLIEKQELWRADKGASEAELLLHSPRQPADLALDERAERRHFHQSRITVAPLVGSDSMQIGVEVEIFLDAEILVQPESLRHIANLRLDLLRIGGNVDAENTQITGISGHQSGSQTHERGLPRSIWSDQHGERAAPDLEGQVIERPRDYAFVTGKRLMDIIAYKGRRELSGRTHCWPRATTPMPESGSGGLSFVGRYTVAGEPRWSWSDGSFTKTLTS